MSRAQIVARRGGREPNCCQYTFAPGPPLAIRFIRRVQRPKRKMQPGKERQKAKRECDYESNTKRHHMIAKAPVRSQLVVRNRSHNVVIFREFLLSIINGTLLCNLRVSEQWHPTMPTSSPSIVEMVRHSDTVVDFCRACPFASGFSPRYDERTKSRLLKWIRPRQVQTLERLCFRGTLYFDRFRSFSARRESGGGRVSSLLVQVP